MKWKPIALVAAAAAALPAAALGAGDLQPRIDNPPPGMAQMMQSPGMEQAMKNAPQGMAQMMQSPGMQRMMDGGH